jgi:hypothetical protein
MLNTLSRPGARGVAVALVEIDTPSTATFLVAVAVALVDLAQPFATWLLCVVWNICPFVPVVT